MPSPERDELLRILRQDAVKQIDFWCFGLHVDKAFYDRVIAKIANGDVAAWTNPDLTRQTGAAAGYNAGTDTMLLKETRCTTLLAEMQALHECTHCGMDIMQFAVRWYYQEAIAYIAGACFGSGRNGGGTCPAWQNPLDRLYGLADEVTFNVPPGGEVGWGPFIELAQTVKYHPTYQNQLRDWGEGPGTTNGVKGKW